MGEGGSQAARYTGVEEYTVVVGVHGSRVVRPHVADCRLLVGFPPNVPASDLERPVLGRWEKGGDKQI